MGEHKDELPYDEIVNKTNLLLVLLFTALHQVSRREMKKQEDEKMAEIIEAEKFARKGIMTILSERKLGIHLAVVNKATIIRFSS